MEIHGGLPQEFLFCEAGSFRDYGQHLLQSNSLQNQLRFKRNRDTLSLKLEPEPLPECLGTLLGGSGHSPILGSPDMNLLKLESPELERLIMNQPSEDMCSGSSYRNFTTSTLTHRDIACSKSSKAFSPLISADDLQFITETNQALESILPRSHFPKGNNMDSFQHIAEMESFLEPLQQVPDSDLSSMKMAPEKRTNNPNSNHHQHHQAFKRQAEHDNAVRSQENYRFASCSPIFRDRHNNSECKTTSIYERFSNADNVYDNNASYVYDLSQPTMVSSRFNQPSGLEKDPQFSMLPLPPIDLEVQEIVKRERKKLKNRVAASKCRKKKLEREAQLEVRVQHLKDKNIELNALSNALRQQATELKQRIMEHMSSGCHTRLVHY